MKIEAVEANKVPWVRSTTWHKTSFWYTEKSSRGCCINNSLKKADHLWLQTLKWETDSQGCISSLFPFSMQFHPRRKAMLPAALSLRTQDVALGIDDSRIAQRKHTLLPQTVWVNIKNIALICRVHWSSSTPNLWSEALQSNNGQNHWEARKVLKRENRRFSAQLNLNMATGKGSNIRSGQLCFCEDSGFLLRTSHDSSHQSNSRLFHRWTSGERLDNCLVVSWFLLALNKSRLQAFLSELQNLGTL